MNISARSRGVTLIEMMVVISIILILLSAAVPLYSHTIVRAREDNLRQNLRTLNKLILQYALDRGKPPKELDDLKTAGYLKSIPKDITGNVDTWQTEPLDGIMSLDQTDTEGIIGVHSGSNAVGSDGTAYSEW